MSTATNPCCHFLSFRPAPPNSRFSIRVHLKPLLPRFPLNSSIHCVSTLSRRRRNKWEILCFRREESSSENFESKSVEDKLAEDLVPTPEINQPSDPRKEWASSLYKAVESIFVTKPWVVPWTAKTIVQVMLLWVASFWVIGSWIIPIIAHTAGYRKEFMTHRGQALYSLLTDVAEGLTGMAILHRCLSRFHPLPPGWFKFSFEGKWQFDVGLGCLMFPLVNRLSQGPSGNGTLCSGRVRLCPHLGGDCVPRVPSTVVDEIYAGMVLYFGEFNSFCFGTFQYAEDVTSDTAWGGDGYCVCKD